MLETRKLVIEEITYFVAPARQYVRQRTLVFNWPTNCLS